MPTYDSNYLDKDIIGILIKITAIIKLGCTTNMWNDRINILKCKSEEWIKTSQMRLRVIASPILMFRKLPAKMESKET